MDKKSVAIAPPRLGRKGPTMTWPTGYRRASETRRGWSCRAHGSGVAGCRRTMASLGCDGRAHQGRLPPNLPRLDAPTHRRHVGFAPANAPVRAGETRVRKRLKPHHGFRCRQDHEEDRCVPRIECRRSGELVRRQEDGPRSRFGRRGSGLRQVRGPCPLPRDVRFGGERRLPHGRIDFRDERGERLRQNRRPRRGRIHAIRATDEPADRQLFHHVGAVRRPVPEQPGDHGRLHSAHRARDELPVLADWRRRADAAVTDGLLYTAAARATAFSCAKSAPGKSCSVRFRPAMPAARARSGSCACFRRRIRCATGISCSTRPTSSGTIPKRPLSTIWGAACADDGGEEASPDGCRSRSSHEVRTGAQSLERVHPLRLCGPSA